jgi:DnaK suppressor protein
MDANELIERMEQMRKDASARLVKLEKKVVHREEALPADFSEQAIELQNQETMEQLTSQVQDELHGIQLALRRVEQGTYGNCTTCDAAIECERLAALPITSLCSNCANTASAGAAQNA